MQQERELELRNKLANCDQNYRHLEGQYSRCADHWDGLRQWITTRMAHLSQVEQEIRARPADDALADYYETVRHTLEEVRDHMDGLDAGSIEKA